MVIAFHSKSTVAAPVFDGIEDHFDTVFSVFTRYFRSQVHHPR